MGKQLAVLIVGIGIEVVFFILDKTMTTIPCLVQYGGYILGGILILGGLIWFIWPNTMSFAAISRLNYLKEDGEALRRRIAEAERQTKYGIVSKDEFREIIEESMQWTRQCVAALKGSKWQRYFREGHPSGMNAFLEGKYDEIFEWVDNRLERLKQILSKAQ